MKKFNIRPWGCLFVLLAFLCGMVACSTETTTEDTVPTSDTQPMYLSLSLSQTSVKTDNSDSSEITATVLDASRFPVEGALVSFSASGGQLTAVDNYELTSSGVATDAAGMAKMSFSSGTVEKKNQVVTVTAQVMDAGLIQNIPVQVTGTTVIIETGNTSLEIGGDDTATCTISVRDAGGVSINNANVQILLDEASTGAVILSANTATTDVNGKVDVNVTGAVRGTAVVRVNVLGATAVQSFTVESLGAAFSIIRPDEEVLSLSTGTTLRVLVSDPSPGARRQVVFTTTLGRWTGADGANSAVVDLDTNNQALARLVSDEAGVATVEVYDIDNSSVKDRLTVAISAPPEEAAKINLQASTTSLAPSSDPEVANSITLYATVRNQFDQVVGNAPVHFYLDNPSGGGEFISPVVVFTNNYGIAETKLTSGPLSSDTEGINCYATVLGAASSLTSAPVNIIIGGTASSLTIGASLVLSPLGQTGYSKPFSIQVNDSAGNPVEGAEITLKIRPTAYATGYWDDEDNRADYTWYQKTAGVVQELPGRLFYPIEDQNGNLILDGDENDPNGEDSVDPTRTDYPNFSFDVYVPVYDEETGIEIIDWDVVTYSNVVMPGHGDRLLTPAYAAAGSVPAIVTTEENGIADFEHIYLRNYALWLEVEIEASTVVYGTEIKATHRRVLGFIESDAKYLRDSPFNPSNTVNFD